ncbi:PREDICTED: interleukin-31 receptor subunit alpha [Dipodomys ordii]|uniref:Interleukin-31 receptor subunit alpha n=1 Tax=Dipodomys ordii TaxID=10020 RepID=A0A1S3FBG3_DIPOR|nr:PREDICTED: interleukin-31 receptor subunit alpha [Dipodomys ordii]
MWTWVLWIFPLLFKLSLTALPAKPENISCVLYYNKNMTCTWSPEKESSPTTYTVKLTYSYGKYNRICEANSTTGASCYFLFPLVIPPDNCSIEVKAQNKDGVIKSDTTYWYLDDIVKTEPPEILSVKPVLGIKRMIQIHWKTHEIFPPGTCLDYMLRYRTINSTHWVEIKFESNYPAYNLTDLQAFTEYVIALRFMTIDSRFWSDWSQEKVGMTEEEAPHGLNLWRILRPAEMDGMRTVRLLWKKARGAPVLEKILGYNIWYFPENNIHHNETRNTTNQQLDLHLSNETYWVFVTAYNSLGESPGARLRISATQEKPFRCIEVVQAYRLKDQLVVEWKSTVPEVNKWMIEWFPDLNPELSAFSWESVSQARNWTIEQDKLKPLWCYNISVYPILQDRVGEPYSIQTYSEEGIPTEGPEAKVENIGVRTATITWKEIPKSQRNGFISNYTIFYQAEGGKEFSKTMNSGILQYDLKSLTRKTYYTVRVMASTKAGGFNGTEINFKTFSISIMEIILITSLVGGGLLMLIILTVASNLKKPNRLTHLCCPHVPNPAESSIASWHGDNLKDKLNLKEFDDSVNTEEDQILKPCPAPTDLIDKLVVNFENFLEEISTEEAGKSQKTFLGGETNEYVTSPNRPGCAPWESFEGPQTSTEIPSRKPQDTTEICSEAVEQLYYSDQSLGSNHVSEEGTPNPYLKNSVTTREFLVHEKVPEQIKEEF